MASRLDSKPSVDDFLANVLTMAAELERLRAQPAAFARLLVLLAQNGSGPERHGGAE